MTCTCPQCERSFEPNAKHQIYDFQECRYQGWVQKEVEAAEGSAQRVEVHPLADARAEQEATAVNRRYGLLIRQAIIDRLKTTGTCHADDLEPLYPADELARKRCRKLAGAQFGSLASPRGSKEPLIREKERRKSSIPERKCAKSGVYEFTKAGWLKYGRAGNSASTRGVGHGAPSEQKHAEFSSSLGTPASAGSGEAGLTSPGSGADGAETSQEPPGPEEAPVISTASPDKQLAGVSAGRPTPQGMEGLERDQKPADAHSGENRNCQPVSGIGAPSPQGSGGAILPCSSSDTALPDQHQSGRDRQVRGAGSLVEDGSESPANKPRRPDSSQAAETQPARHSDPTLAGDSSGFRGRGPFTAAVSGEAQPSLLPEPDPESWAA